MVEIGNGKFSLPVDSALVLPELLACVFAVYLELTRSCDASFLTLSKNDWFIFSLMLVGLNSIVFKVLNGTYKIILYSKKKSNLSQKLIFAYFFPVTTLAFLDFFNFVDWHAVFVIKLECRLY